MKKALAEKLEQQKLIAEMETLEQRVAEIKQQLGISSSSRLTKDEQLFLAIAKQSPYSMWASRGKNNNYEIVLWNKGAEQIYGFSAEEALGKNYIDLIVDDLEAADSASDCDAVINDGKVFNNFLATDTTKDGTRRVMLTNCFRIYDDEQNEYYQAEIGLDVSELQQSEGEYRSLREMAIRHQQQLERITLLQRLRMISNVISSSIIFEEDGLQKVLENIVTNVDELIGEKTFSVICLYGDDKNISKYSTYIYNKSFLGNDHFQNDGLAILATIGKFAIETNKSYFVDQAGDKPIGFPLPLPDVPMAVMPLLSRDFGVGILYVQLRQDYKFTDDVKEVLSLFADQAAVAVQNARLIQNLKSLNKMIAEKQEILTRSQIAVDFAHRMNNMASPFLIWVDLLREELEKTPDYDREVVYEYLDEIENQSKELLYEASRIEQVPEEETVNIKELLEAMVRNIKIQSRDLQVNLVVSPNLKTVKAIKSLLSNAIWNVISNALDAMNNSGKVTLRARDVEKNGKNWVELIAKDTGPGIHLSDQEHIFEINYSSKGLGHGYGLWRTKQIIESFGGKIELTASNSKQGTTFTFSLPAFDEVDHGK